jgi:hypothetical protein
MNDIEEKRTNEAEDGDGGPKKRSDWRDEEEHMINRYLLDRRIEIIAIVEGIDSTTGPNTF